MTRLLASDLLKEQILINKNTNCDRVDLEQLFLFILKIKRSDFYSKSHYLTSEDYKNLSDMINRRNDGEPLAYIVGKIGFWNIDLKVNKHVLVPRPETETIIELVLNSFDQQSIKILDAGTGSGAIALALASERKNWLIYALEKSENSIKIAIDNMNNLGLHVGFFRSNWLDSIQSSSLDVVVSNPPYIAANDLRLEADGVSKEPLEALVSKDQGFADLNKIIKDSFRCLVKGGRIFVEHAPEQSDLVEEFYKKSNYTAIEVHKDLNGDNRVSSGIKN
ncbi:peptide chain release factor N(5)-glutamine methyltransferase [Gammaproteobacteria bacterium]|nr:peptide chain release factor N(5)-glutamine methyltransferase [Gammaproteobacteria bacterium]